MKRRLTRVLHACAVVSVAAGMLSVEKYLHPDGGSAARGPASAAGRGEPDADICTDDHLELRMARELGAPARPAWRRDAGGRPGPLVLRLGAAIGAFLPVAIAADPAPPTAPSTAEPSSADAPVADPEAAPAPPQPASPPTRRQEPRGPIRLDLLSRARDLGPSPETSEAFAPKSWVVVVPPPPPPPPPPPEPPRAPPLPFRFAGALEDGAGRTSYFLMRGNAMLTVAVGDTIDGTYTLDSDNGGVLQFTFVPLRERQQLPFGAAR